VAALFLAALTGGAVGADGYGRTRRLHMKNKVLEM
jgi:mannosidase alpha-like ER degradation enhancer 1